MPNLRNLFCVGDTMLEVFLWVMAITIAISGMVVTAGMALHTPHFAVGMVIAAFIAVSAIRDHKIAAQAGADSSLCSGCRRCLRRADADPGSGRCSGGTRTGAQRTRLCRRFDERSVRAGAVAAAADAAIDA